MISIHALREEGDFSLRCFCCLRCFISIHALREEGDSTSISVAFAFLRFLSTPSARRATGNPWNSWGNTAISIHALREEGDYMGIFAIAVAVFISIHALREEGDFFAHSIVPNDAIFLSTPSARRATGYAGQDLSCSRGFLSTPSARRATHHPAGQSNRHGRISIHALREEGDPSRRSK